MAARSDVANASLICNLSTDQQRREHFTRKRLTAHVCTEETATIHQGTLALEVARCRLPLPHFPGERLRGRGYPGDDETGEATLESELFSFGSGQAMVLR